MRITLFVLLLAAAGMLAADLRPSAAPSDAEAASARRLSQAAPPAAPTVVEVAFLKNGWVARVKREVPKRIDPEVFALRELLKGPTREEKRRGLRTSFSGDARLRSLRVTKDAWVASFNRSTFGTGTAERRRQRLWQITATLAPLGPQEHVAVATAGRFLTIQPLGVRPRPLGAAPGEEGYRYSIRGVQLQLAMLAYLDGSDVTGTLDYLTEQALLAFQSWEGLVRTGTVTGETQLALVDAAKPRPARPGAGRHVEIFRDLGVLLTVERGEVVRAVHASAGVGGITPVGDFRVYVKSLMSWSVPFEVWMPYASYFRGGIAMHQSPDVPSYPASHGCVRLPEGEAERVYEFVEVGTPVLVT